MNYAYPNSRLLIFTKAPVPGQVKTRLQPQLNAQQCAELQQQLIKQTLKVTTAAMLCPVELWCAGETHTFLQQCSQQFNVELKTQSGTDLGQRMANAMSLTLRNTEQAIIIGCDCPVLNAQYLKQTLAALAENDVVLIPAEDGGYVLIASKIDSPDIFAAIDWGSEQVLLQTRHNLQHKRIKWAELETLWDIDRPTDLERLAQVPQFTDWLRHNI